MSPPAVAVVVPARQEEARIDACVRSVRRAVEYARRCGLVGPSVVVVVAHRCDDATEVRARAALGSDGVVVPDDRSGTVGEVRAAGAAVALDLLGAPPERTWVLSTDADTVVPFTWVARTLRLASRHRCRAVVGMARLDRWRGSARAWAAYHGLVRAGMRSWWGRHQHDHVYGANLAVRADAYLAVGGFAACPVAEDHALVRRLGVAGHPVLRTRWVVVRTSGRRAGRAVGGLADRLASLESAAATGRGGSRAAETGGADSDSVQAWMW